MANRYWVGGTETWNATAGSKWATTSGGSGGETVPSSSDNVFFDANSGANTVTIGSAVTAKSLTFTGFTGTLAGTQGITVSGNITLDAGMTITHTGIITINANSTIACAGKYFSEGVTINGSGITVQFGDAFLSTGTVTLSQGTLTTNNYAVTSGLFQGTGALVQVLNAGSSVFNCSSFYIAGTNATYDIDEITLNTPGSVTIGSNTIGNTTITSSSAAVTQISGEGPFSNLTLDSVYKDTLFSFGSNTTVNGTFTARGTDKNKLLSIYSSSRGTQRTITAATVDVKNVAFTDIVGAGAGTWDGKNVRDYGNNSGITFSEFKY